MTAFNYARPQATADRLLARYGRTGTLRRPTTASGPAYAPVAGSPTDYAVTFAIFDYTNREIDGTRVLATDKKAYLAAGNLAVEPKTSDKLLVGGVEHSIIAVAPLDPAGTAVYYELQVRR